jgi:hypothetical protein
VTGASEKWLARNRQPAPSERDFCLRSSGKLGWRRLTIRGDKSPVALGPIGGRRVPESDDSADWRAVKVHALIGDMPLSPPPPSITPVPPPVVPLPGGARFTRWEIAAPGGAFIAAVAGGGFNVSSSEVQNASRRVAISRRSPASGQPRALWAPIRMEPRSSNRDPHPVLGSGLHFLE